MTKASVNPSASPTDLGGPPAETVRPGQRKRTAWLLAAIVIGAGCLRFPALDRFPPGIYADEAVNGVQGWEAAQTGHFKMFYPENSGREGLWVNLIGLSERLIGVGPFSLRIWSALSGTLTVAGLFFLAWELFQSYSIALLSAFFVATSFWHLNFSRIAFPAIMVPLFLTWGSALLLAAWRTSLRRTMSQPSSAWGARAPWLLSLAGGICFGLGFHSYAAYRIAPLAVAPLFFVFWPRERVARRGFLIDSGLWLGAAVAVALPLSLYFWHHPQDFFLRASQVSILKGANPLGTFAKSFVQTLAMFNIRGDRNWRHNLASSPELVLPVGCFFLLGIWFAGSRSLQQKGLDAKVFNRYSIPLWWLAVMLLPEELTAEGIPHALRSIGAIPAAMMLAALGFDWSYHKWPFRGALVALLVLIAGLECNRYFRVWARDPNTARAFAKIYVDVGQRLNSLPASTPRFVIVDTKGTLMTHQNPDGSQRDIPMPAQTIMFGTIGHPPATYLLPQDVPAYSFPPEAVTIVVK